MWDNFNADCIELDKLVGKMIDLHHPPFIHDFDLSSALHKLNNWTKDCTL